MHRSRNSRVKYCPSYATYGEVLADDCSIDLLLDPRSQTTSLLVHTRDGESEVAEFRVAERLFRPGKVSSIYRNALQLPERAADFGSPENLFAELQAPVERRGFPADVSALAAYFSLATLFADVLPQAPVLSITGPEREAMVLLDVLVGMVRRGLRIGEFNSAVVRALPMEIGPTLLINCGEMDRAARRLFRNTNFRGIITQHSGKPRDFYCAKAIYDGLSGAFPARSHALRIRLQPFAGRPPLFHGCDAAKIARELQPKLTEYRARYVHRVLNSQFDVADFAVSARIQAQVFGAPLVGSACLVSKLINLLEEHQNQALEEVWTDLRSVALEACIQKAHIQPGKRISVGEIAHSTNFMLSVRGDDTKHSEREVGAILSDFGLPKRRHSEGWMILLDAAVCARLHHLALQHGVLNRAPADSCKLCHSINDPAAGAEGEDA
jgi:hypothetical protein